MSSTTYVTIQVTLDQTPNSPSPNEPKNDSEQFELAKVTLIGSSENACGSPRLQILLPVRPGHTVDRISQLRCLVGGLPAEVLRCFMTPMGLTFDVWVPDGMTLPQDHLRIVLKWLNLAACQTRAA